MSYYYTVEQGYKHPYYVGQRDAAHAAVFQERHMGVLANNLANVNTPGYKEDRLVFNDLMERKVKTAHDQGALNKTGDDLHVAIGGDGFFQVQTREGIRLTRDGSFRMRGDGNLVNAAGFSVLGQGGGPIILNPQGPKVYIDPTGAIMQGEEQVGRLSVVRVEDKDTLEKSGHNLFAAVGGGAPQTQPATEYSLAQGYLETSNVQVVKQMVGMINAHRGFESYMKALHTQDEIDKLAVTQVGRAA